jgi:AcrR family transcriptional regulator
MNPLVQQSLRERSKARRRAAIERAATRLFAERGYEATTIADIAAEAEVAPRTVSLYFPSKADLALVYANAMAERLTAAFAARTPSESPLDVIDRWLLAEGTMHNPEDARQLTPLFEANRAEPARRSAQMAAAGAITARALAEYLAVEVDHPAVRVAGAAIGGVLGEYLAALAAGNDVRLMHETAMRLLRAGIDVLRSAKEKEASH